MSACGEWMPLAEAHCARRSGHVGHHRSHYVLNETSVCGEWMPLAKEPCARRSGHARYGRWGQHKTREALDNARERRWFGVRAAA